MLESSRGTYRKLLKESESKHKKYLDSLIKEMTKEYVFLKESYRLTDALSLLYDNSDLLYKFESGDVDFLFNIVKEDDFKIEVDNPKILKSFPIKEISMQESYEETGSLIDDIFSSSDLEFLTEFNSHFFVVDDMDDKDYETFNIFLCALHESNEKAMNILNKREDLMFFPIDLYKELINNLPIDLFFAYKF